MIKVPALLIEDNYRSLNTDAAKQRQRINITKQWAEGQVFIEVVNIAHHGEDVNNRPFLELRGYLQGMRDDFHCDVGEMVFSLEDAPRIHGRYEFSDNELLDLVAKGYFSRGFKCPEMFFENTFDLPINYDAIILLPNEADRPPLCFVDIHDQMSMQLNSENTGYTLATYFAPVQEQEETVKNLDDFDFVDWHDVNELDQNVEYIGEDIVEPKQLGDETPVTPISDIEDEIMNKIKSIYAEEIVPELTKSLERNLNEQYVDEFLTEDEYYEHLAQMPKIIKESGLGWLPYYDDDEFMTDDEFDAQEEDSVSDVVDNVDSDDSYDVVDDEVIFDDQVDNDMTFIVSEEDVNKDFSHHFDDDSDDYLVDETVEPDSASELDGESYSDEMDAESAKSDASVKKARVLARRSKEKKDRETLFDVKEDTSILRGGRKFESRKDRRKAEDVMVVDNEPIRTFDME